MKLNPKNWLSDYFKRKKSLSIFFDIVFIILIILLLIPSTRREVSAFLIRTTALPPSRLDSEDQFSIDDAALNWQIYDDDGHTYKFEDLLNKPVFINFWATWCPPCIAEFPSISDLYENAKNQANFILLSNEKPEIVKTFAKKHGYEKLPFYYCHTNAVPPDFESSSIPTTFIVTKNKKVILKKTGAARWNSGKMVEILKQLNRE